MADLSTLWLPTLAKMRAAGVSKYMVKITAPTADAAYYCLGDVVDAKINSKPITQNDGYGRPHIAGHALELVIPTHQASATEIAILDDLILNQPVQVNLAFTDTLRLNTALLGMSWKLICDGDMNGFRRIEYTHKGNLKLTELDGLTDTSTVTVGSPTGTDLLYTLAQTPVKANEKPNGLSLIEWQVSGDSTYADIGEFRNAKYTFETVGEMRGGGRGYPAISAIKLTFDAEILCTTDTEMNLLDTLATSVLNLKLTHMDGAVLALAGTNFGITVEPDFSGNTDKNRTMKIHAEGTLINNGTTFVTTGGTGWGALWT